MTRLLAGTLIAAISLALAACTEATPSPPPMPTQPATLPAPTQPGFTQGTSIPITTPSPAQSGALYLENRGGPAFTVRIGDKDITTVGCGDYLNLTPGQDNVPPLPWDLTLIRLPDGSTLETAQIAELPRWFVQMGDHSLGFSDNVVLGPAGPTCAPPATPTQATPSLRPTPIATPADGYTRFPSHNFWFDYPSNWRFISGYDHCGHNGPTLLAAVGIGDFATGWHYDGNTLICGPPRWTVPDNGIVLVYRIDAMMGPQPFPSLGPGEEWVDVGGRSTVFSQTADSMTWHLPGAPEYIEVRWGPVLSQQAPELIANIIASWNWEP